MKTIRIVGKTSDGRSWYKEFHCSGRKNVDEVCEDCALRFQCFSGRETIEIPVEELPIKERENIEADVIADFIVPTVKVAIREANDGRKKVQINFGKVRKFT